MADESFTTGDFHTVAHKQIVNAVYEALVDAKLDWETVAPLLEAGRRVCRDDFREAARIRFHAVRTEGEDWVEAEEAYLGIAVADRDDGADWLAETFWVSDIALADGDPEQARRIVTALERSIARIRDRLADLETEGDPDALPEPPSDGDSP